MRMIVGAWLWPGVAVEQAGEEGWNPWGSSSGGGASGFLHLQTKGKHKVSTAERMLQVEMSTLGTQVANESKTLSR